MTTEAMTLAPGARAPDLELTADDGTPVHLAAVWQPRPLVLAFLHDLGNPFTGDHAVQLRDGASAIENAGAGLAAVCPTQPEQAALFAERWALPYALLCDPDRRAYEAFGANGGASFVIATDGRIRFARRAENAADYPPTTVILEAVCAITGAEPPAPPGSSAVMSGPSRFDGDAVAQTGFACAKCGYLASERVEIATAGGFLSRLFNLQHRKFMAVVCSQCGYAELYKKATAPLGNVVDFLGG